MSNQSLVDFGDLKGLNQPQMVVGFATPGGLSGKPVNPYEFVKNRGWIYTHCFLTPKCTSKNGDFSNSTWELRQPEWRNARPAWGKSAAQRKILHETWHFDSNLERIVSCHPGLSICSFSILKKIHSAMGKLWKSMDWINEQIWPWLPNQTWPWNPGRMEKVLRSDLSTLQTSWSIMTGIIPAMFSGI